MVNPTAPSAPPMRIVGFPQELLEKLAAHFPDDCIRQDRKRDDGFEPNYIPWDVITHRLDECFSGGWSFDILSYRHEFGYWIVHGRLSVTAVAVDDNGKAFSHTVTKDAIGSWQIELDGAGRAKNLDFDLKSAQSDGRMAP